MGDRVVSYVVFFVVGIRLLVVILLCFSFLIVLAFPLLSLCFGLDHGCAFVVSVATARTRGRAGGCTSSSSATLHADRPHSQLSNDEKRSEPAAIFCISVFSRSSSLLATDAYRQPPLRVSGEAQQSAGSPCSLAW